MHWKVLKPPRSGVATIKKVMTTLSMPQEEDPDGSVLLLLKEREVPRAM